MIIFNGWNRREQVLNKLNTLNEEAILSNNVDDLCIQFESEYLFDIPKLIEKEISVDYGEAEEPLSAYVSFNSERPIEKYLQLPITFLLMEKNYYLVVGRPNIK